MNRYLLLIGIVTGAFAFVSLGCGSKTTVLNSSQVPAGITVSGSGEVFGEPDVAVVSLGVDSRADTVAKAREAAATSMNAMLGALKDGGVAEKDIQTTRFDVQPVYDYSNNKQTLIGFTVSNIVTAKIRKIDATGDLIDAAVKAGGDLARVDSLMFTIDDPSALQAQARQKAMAEAKSKAETLAQAGGITLGAPIAISETGGPAPVTFGAADFARAEAASTPIQVGQLDVVIQVQVVYGVGG